MLYEHVPKSEVDLRVSRLQEMMRETNLDGVLITQQADLFYFSGTIQNSFLFLPREGRPILMVKKDFERAKKESPIEDIVPLKKSEQILEILNDYGIKQLDVIGLELDVLPTALFFHYQKVFSQAELVDASDMLRKIRMIKSAYEIDNMRKAGEMVNTVVQKAKEIIVEGMKEIDLAAELEIVARKMGHPGIVKMRRWNQGLFYGHVFSGAAAAISSYMDTPLGGQGTDPYIAQGASYEKINRHEPIMIDFSGYCNGYLVDQSRVFVIDELPLKLKTAFELALKIEAEMVENMKSGIDAEELYKIGLDRVSKTDYTNNFMGFENNRVKFIGHGVGLEIDEYPFIAKGFHMPLEKGMTFALEPKFVFPDQGAVGIENTFLITEHGAERLTFTDNELIVIG